MLSLEGFNDVVPLLCGLLPLLALAASAKPERAEKVSHDNGRRKISCAVTSRNILTPGQKRNKSGERGNDECLAPQSIQVGEKKEAGSELARTQSAEPVRTELPERKSGRAVDDQVRLHKLL